MCAEEMTIPRTGGDLNTAGEWETINRACLLRIGLSFQFHDC
ncbi:protein of unknown function [Burkholderia multivorans]